MTFQPPIVPARTSGASAYCGYAVVVGGTFASPSPWLATIPLIEGHIFVQSCFFSQTDPLSTVRRGFLSHLVSDAPAVVEIFKEICKATLHTKGVDLQTWSWRATPPSCGGPRPYCPPFAAPAEPSKLPLLGTKLAALAADTNKTAVLIPPCAGSVGRVPDTCPAYASAVRGAMPSAWAAAGAGARRAPP